MPRPTLGLAETQPLEMKLLAAVQLNVKAGERRPKKREAMGRSRLAG